MSPSFAVCLFLTTIESVLCTNCYWNAKCPYKYFSTKTSYDAVRGDIRESTLSDWKETCTPISLWSLNRHGTRHGGEKDTLEMKAVSSLRDMIVQSHRSGTSQLCSQDIENLSNWKWDDDLDNSASDLTKAGFEELKHLAQRLKDRFPNLLENYEKQKFYFRPTVEQRTMLSSVAFVLGLFGDSSNATIDMPRSKDDVIRPYANCERYLKEVKNNPLRNVEHDAYLISPDFNIVKQQLQERLGIKYQLTPNNITAFYQLCRFELSWSPTKVSPWCALFSHHNFHVLEYVDDLIHFYRNGYGFKINENLGATALKDLYQRFDKVKTGAEETSLVAYFTHDTMMEMVFSALGLFNDGYNLTASNRLPNRKWRTTFISSFATNLLAVLYRCVDGEIESHRVAFYVNEQPVDVCARGWCSWEEFHNKFLQYINSNLDFCKLKNSNL